MKKHILLLLLLPAAFKVFAQTPEIIKKDGLTLEYRCNATDFSPAVKQELIDAFFKVYPLEIKRFNTASATYVIFDVDTAYKGVAATGNAHVRYNPEWFRKHPEDIDVVTHEVMHIVQNYGGKDVPGWLTEGIADYARYTFGINNEAAGWKLTDYKAGQSYTNAYRITARFLVWAEKHKQQPTLANQLDKAMRSGQYKPELWKQITGKTVDELWAEYITDPVI
jgi:hypothetical protein